MPCELKQSGKGTDIKPLKKGSNYAKWFRESANENSQKHTAGAELNRPSCHSVVGVVGNINSPVSNIALQWEKHCAKGGIIGHFARVCWGGTRRQARQQRAYFVLYNPTVCKKIFCETALNTWREKRSREGADRLCIHLQYHSKQSPEKPIS